MQKDEDIIERLLVGGLIGAGLGALLSNNKNDGATIGAIVGAALLGTYKANQKAQATKIPMVIEKNGKLYQINADGTEHYLRDIEKPTIQLEEKFKLK